MRSKNVLCSLAVAVSAALAMPAAFAGGPMQYERINAKMLHEGESYDQIVVKYRPGSAQAQDQSRLLQSVNLAAQRALPQAAARRAGGQALKADFQRRLAVGADVVRLSQKLDRAETEALMRQIAADPAVEYVEPVMRMVRFAVPDDPLWADQWGLHTPAESGGGINLAPALDKATGEGVVVAVLDTGVVEHDDLSANVLMSEGYDFHDRVPGGADPGDWTDGSEGCGVGSSSWHGTHVAGTVAAVTDNSVGVAGVAPDAVILPVRVLGKCGGYSSDIADALMWTAGGEVSGVPAHSQTVEVINMSLGGTMPAACPNIYKDALSYVHQQGITVVVAAGNDDADVTGAGGVGYTMGNCSNDLVVVGGVGPLGRRGGVSSNGTTEAGWGSNHGARVDVAGPMGSGWDYNEEQVLSTVDIGNEGPEGSGYAYYYGTSMASPHVAGVAALILSASPEPLGPDEVKAILKESARPFPAPVDKPVGVGIVDADAAVTMAIEGPPEPCDPEVEQCTPDAIELTNRVPLSGQGGAEGSQTLYAIEVPADASGPLNITTTGGSGNVSLHVSFEEEPEPGSAEWSSSRPGNNEVVRVNNPTAGVYYIKLVGDGAYSNVTVQARHN